MESGDSVMKTNNIIFSAFIIFSIIIIFNLYLSDSKNVKPKIYSKEDLVKFVGKKLL